MAGNEDFSRAERLRYWREPGTQKILNALKKDYPQGKWQSVGQHKLQGRCPFHNDNSPSSYINTQLGFFKCATCGKVHTDIVRMFSEGRNQDYTTTFKQLIVVEFGLKVAKGKEKSLEEFDGYQEMMRLVCDVSSNLLATASKNPGDSDLAFAHNAVNYLRKRRINVDMAVIRGVGIFPRLRDVHEFYTKKPAAYQRAYALFKDFFVRQGIVPEALHLPGKYGGDFLTFPHYTAPDTIGRIKLRGTTAQGAYSAWVGPGSEQGFFGLNAFPMLLNAKTRRTASETVYIVEGEFDQLSFYQAMEAHGADTIIISGSGAGVGGVADLPYYGFKKIIAVGDNDEGGRKFTKRVFSQIEESTQAAFFAFSYPDKFGADADPDSIVKQCKYQEFHDAIHDVDNWQEPHVWGAEQVRDICAADPAMDLGSKLCMVREYADLVPEGTIRGEYLSKVATDLGLSETRLRQDMASADTEPGFILAIKRELSALFEPLAMEGDFNVLCHSKVNNRLFSLPMKRQRDMVLQLQNYCFETDSFSWVSHRMGIPEFVSDDPHKKKGGKRMEKQQYREVEEYVYRSTDSYVSEKAQPVEQFAIRRQGVHFFDARDEHTDMQGLPEDCAEKRLLIVNGLDVYLGELRETNGVVADKVIYEKLKTPLHSKYLLETSDRHKWANSISDVETLNDPVTFEEFKGAIEDCRVMTSMFPWDKPDIMNDYFPCLFALQPLTMMCENFPLTLLNAETMTGKSTFIKTMVRGGNGYGVVEHSTGYDDYTAAGLTQAAGGSSLLMCIDEFEDADDATAGRRAAVVRNTLEMFRNISEGTLQTRGTQSGQHREEWLRFGVMAGSIHTFKKEEDLNRWVICKLVAPQSQVTPPVVALRQRFDKKRMAEIRRILTLYMLQNAGVFYKLQKELQRELFVDKVVPCTQHRFLHGLLPVISVAKHLGWDYVDYATRHVADHEKNLSLSVMSEGDRLFRAIFETKGVVLEQDNGIPRTVTEVLNDSDSAMKLSGANCGVYYMPGKDYIVLDTYGISVNILQKNSVYRNIVNTHSVFQRLLRHPDVHHKPQMILNDPAMLNLLNTYISRTPPEELLIVYLNDIRKNGQAVNDLTNI